MNRTAGEPRLELRCERAAGGVIRNRVGRLCASARLCALAAVAPGARAINCAGTSTGRTPISDLGAGLYLGQFQGGLYPGGLNTPPPAHSAVGVVRANAIQPLNTLGQPDAGGKYVLLSIGMSNTTQEFCSAGGGSPCDPWTFMGQAAVNADVNHTTLVIANGARGGQTIATWDSPTDPNYNNVRDGVLAPQGLTEAQVQAIWVKEANPGPQSSLPAQNADAYTMVTGLGNLVRAAKSRYPNLKIIFLSNRIYAGYADTQLNPEPYAYETGFGVKWLIQAQINQMGGGGVDPRGGNLDYNTVAPWLAWGPDLWADGVNPRSDGLTWLCGDYANDGTHPAQPARQKVGTMLLDFMLASPFSTPWFRAGGAGCPADLDGDGAVGAPDLAALLGAWGLGGGPADLDGDGGVTAADMALLLGAWGACG